MDFDALKEALEYELFPVDLVGEWLVDGAWSTFRSQFTSTVEALVPRRMVTPRKKQQPWITKDVRRYLRNRNKVWRSAKTKGTDESWSVF